MLVPLAGDAKQFANSTHTGTRYLIITTKADNSLSGNIVELLLRRTAAPLDTVTLFTSLLRGYQQGQLRAPAQGDGLVLFYSANYEYLSGRHFRDGRLLPGAARLLFRPRVGPGTSPTSSRADQLLPQEGPVSNILAPAERPCTDWYSGETGEYITTTGDCGGGTPPPPLPDTGGGANTPAPGSGGTGPDGYGGTGGSGTSIGTLSPTTVLVRMPDKPVQNVREYLKCLDASQGATFSVYTRQPREGTSDIWAGTLKRPDVGHTFISITQNGITRVLGFYPTSEKSILEDGPSIMGDNSQEGYHVRITTNISPARLAALLAYINSCSSATYSLKNYNCTDFGIGAAAAVGLPLPDSYGSWGLSGGSTPAVLGQNMRTVPLPAGATRTLSGTSPANTGGC